MPDSTPTPAAECGPIAREELEMVSGWSVAGQALFCELADRSLTTALAPLPDAWRRLADQGYAAAARSFLDEPWAPELFDRIVRGVVVAPTDAKTAPSQALLYGSDLCIVRAAARSPAAGKVYLPFEDDRLSLILSKAFLLADDSGITDESILRQIRRGAP
jgi:hypothetical protein